jgi:Ni/Fe-hydrogenase 1 B-type cytochrome subunit
MSEAFTVQEHPLPAVLLHWAHLISFIILAVTGLLIYAAPQGWNMDAIRTIHFVVMFVFFFTFIIRVYWAFLGEGSADTGKTAIIRDYEHFVPAPGNKGKFVPYIKYYLFLSKTRPAVAKYNPLQKLAYGAAFPVLIIWMSVTGFAIWSNTPAWMFGWFVNLVGGLGTVRLVHYIGCWLMIVVFMVHLYLVVFEDPVEAYSMLFHVMPDKYLPDSVRDTKVAAEAAKR